MRTKINKEVYNYLCKELSLDRPDLIEFIKKYDEGEQILIELNEEDACTIRDWAGEKLQKKGFDKNYSLTQQGEYLEEIIDLLYV